MKHIHTLTGLRGFAALIVFISHSANEALLPAFLGKGFGQIGVMIFFVLSGFLMAHLYVHEEFTANNARKYILARIGRVVPLYIALLIVSVIISKYIYADFYYSISLYSLSKAFLFIEAPYVFWTIPVEVQFYFIFLGFWYLNNKYGNPYLLFFYFIATVLPSLYYYINFLSVANNFSTYSYAFFIGVFTSFFYKSLRDNLMIAKASGFAGYLLVFLLFINLPELRVSYGSFYNDNFYMKTWGDPLTWGVVYGLFICAVLNFKSVSFLSNIVFVHLGKISYGFYLIHYPVIMYFKEMDISIYLQLFLAFTITVVLAHLSYFYFERAISKKIRDF